MTTALQSWRNVAHGVLEGRTENCPCSRLFSRFLVLLIVTDGIAVVLESNPVLRDRYREFFAAFEFFSVLVFSAEYLARLWIVAEKPAFAGLSPLRARVRYWVSAPWRCQQASWQSAFLKNCKTGAKHCAGGCATRWKTVFWMPVRNPVWKHCAKNWDLARKTCCDWFACNANNSPTKTTALTAASPSVRKTKAADQPA